jgi:hypothetical protein
MPYSSRISFSSPIGSRFDVAVYSVGENDITRPTEPLPPATRRTEVARAIPPFHVFPLVFWKFSELSQLRLHCGMASSRLVPGLHISRRPHSSQFACPSGPSCLYPTNPFSWWFAWHSPDIRETDPSYVRVWRETDRLSGQRGPLSVAPVIGSPLQSPPHTQRKAHRPWLLANTGIGCVRPALRRRGIIKWAGALGSSLDSPVDALNCSTHHPAA